MKNKKLFAILTLVCFMFTLMPVAAFAAQDDAYVQVSKDATNFKDTLSAKTNDTITVQVGGTTTAAVDFIFLVADGALYKANVGNSFTITEEGTYEVYAMSASDAATINSAYILKADRLEAYLEAESLVEECAVLKVKAAEDAYVVRVYDANGTLVGSSDDVEAAGITAYVDLDANGSYGAEKLTAKVQTVGGTNVKNVELDFDDNGVSVVAIDELTARNGEMEFKVYGTTVGKFEVEVSYEDAEAVVAVQVGNVGPAEVTVVAQPAGPKALDSLTENTGIGFKLVDANGNVIKLDSAIVDAYGNNLYQINVIEQPADSDIDETALYLSYDALEDMCWEIYGAQLTEEGKYTFEVALENGASAQASVNIKEFGDPVRLVLMYNDTNVGLGDTTSIKRLLLMDANGVSSSLITRTGLDSKVELSANGKAVKDFDEFKTGVGYGALEVTSDDDYIGSKVKVVAVYDETLVATAEITVVESAVELAFVDKTAEVAVTNELTVNVVNANGEQIALSNATSAQAYVMVLDKPDNSYVAAEATINTANDEVTVDFTPSVAGEYELQVYVTYTETVDGQPVQRYISGVDTITVGAKEGAFKDVVVMSIGASNIVVNSDVKAIDAAPMIENGRTFVPFRALAEAFGAEVSYDEATQSVIAELDGVKVVMTIGSANYTVNGVEKAADVAPFINGSRTMVPVRFVAEAFGINVTPIYAENGAVADVLFAK